MSESIKSDEIYDRRDIPFEDSDLYEDSEEIEYLKYNLAEPDIIPLINKNLYKMRGFNRINNENVNTSDAMSDKTYYESHEQISEVKYNIFMKIFNECKFDETKYSSVIRAKDRTFNLRRLVVQDFNIIENNGKKKISPGEKNYSFIPIDEDSARNCLFYLGKNVINVAYSDENIKSLIINNVKIKDFCKNYFEQKYNIEVTRKIKSQGGKSKKSQIENNKIDNNNNRKAVSLENNIKNDIQNFNQKYNINKNKLISSNDSYKEEYSGDSLYVKCDNENNNDSQKLKRYYFLAKYEKKVDGIFTSHKDINLNIKNKVNFPDFQKDFIYNCKNDLEGHIIFKNFESDKILANEPIILEIKSDFSLFDLMSQIKQTSKIINNTSKEKISISLPRYVIGILCNYDANSATREMAKLNIPYFNDKEKNELEHAINIIDKNKINVVICVIKGEINGYSLEKEDYENESVEIKYRVDLSYMYKKIKGIDIDEEKLKELRNELNEYRSISSEKMFYLTLSQEEYFKIKKNLENTQNSTTIQSPNIIQKENDEKSSKSLSLKDATQKISELENKNSELENKNSELKNKNSDLKNKNSELKNKSSELELKMLELMNKLNEYKKKEKQNQQEEQQKEKVQQGKNQKEPE